MENEIEIGVTTITNVIEVTAQPTDQIIDIGVTDNTDEVVINVTPSVIEININKGGLNSNLVTSVNGKIGDVVLDKNDIGLGNVDNTADYDKMISLDTQIALNNKADLVDGVVPSYQLPSYVDDVLEVANYVSLPLAGEIGKIYVTLDNNKIYRWSGSIYIEIASNSAIWGAITGTLSNQTDLQNALNAKVPYTGAISNVNLGEYGLSTGNIQFDTTPTVPPTTVGSLSWNDSDGTLNLSLKGESVTLQIGQETVARIVNKTATNITLLEGNYQAVRVTGAIGQRPKVDLAQANNDLNSTTTLGLVTETILINQEGFITTSGQVRGINTTGSLQGETWSDGNILYLSGTVAGRITNIKPVAPIHTVIIGFVEYAHITQGKIFVKVDNGYELDELHNVSAIAPNNNEVLTYDLATTLWKPKTIATALGYTPANDSNVVHLTGNEIISGVKTFNNAPILNSITTIINVAKVLVKNPTTGEISEQLLNFSKTVFFNNTNPTSATIFSLDNPPIVNDNSLKLLDNAIYIGTDSSTWVSNGLTYSTYTGSGGAGTPFFISGTTIDAGSNKISDIKRSGSIESTSFKITGGTSNQFLKANGTVDSSVYVQTSRTLTINGVTQDLSANRTFTISSSIGQLITSATVGSVLFVGTGGVLQQDNSQFFWDDTNNRLGIGTTIPSTKLHVVGTVSIEGTTPSINAITTANSTGYFQTAPTTLTNQNFALIRNSATINGSLTRIGLYVAHGTSQIQGITIPTPEVFLTQANKNNIWLFASTAAQGASQINSRLQVGYDQFLPDAANTNALAVNGTGLFTSLAGTGTRTVVASSTGVLSASVTSTSTYKVYTAIISQAGTTAPTVNTLLENSLTNPISFSYIGAGNYTIDCSDFTANKVVCFYQKSSVPVGVSGYKDYEISQSSAGTVLLVTRFNTLVNNDLIKKDQIEIRVYN